MTNRDMNREEALQETLFELMSEKGYNEINVVEIASRANISRQTFYNHFQSKDELLLSYLDEIFDSYMDRISEFMTDYPNKANEVHEILFGLWEENAERLILVLNAGVDHLVFQRFRRYIRRVVGSVVRRNDFTIDQPDLVDYVVDFVAGGFFQLITRWMRNGRPYPASVMSQLIGVMMKTDLLELISKK